MASRKSTVVTEDPRTSNDCADEDSDDEDEGEDDDEEAESEEDEAFDIDDLSSENQTGGSSSPSHSAHDPPATVPDLKTHSAAPHQPHGPTHAAFPGFEYFRERNPSSAASSVAELNENEEHRWRDPAPRPPRLAARHSYTGPMSISSTLTGHLPSHAVPPSTGGAPKVTVSHTRKRDDSAAYGGADPSSSPSSGVPQSSSASRSRIRSRDSSPRKIKSHEDPMASGFAFAVVGQDSDTSAVSHSDCEYK